MINLIQSFRFFYRFLVALTLVGCLATCTTDPPSQPDPPVVAEPDKKTIDLNIFLSQQNKLAAVEKHAQQVEQQNLSLESRLVESQRMLYRASSGQQREQLLVNMLNDPVAAIRLLGMTLTEEKLLEGDTITTELRLALLERLDDTQPEIRRRSALVLRDLGDQAAADTIASRLQYAHESAPEVLSAYLRVMARSPRSEIIDRILDLLIDPDLSSQAAGVLAAALEKQMLTPTQQQLAAERLRVQIEQSEQPTPQQIALLGQVGNESDWQRIEKWVESDNEAVKQAAAGAWASSNRSLVALAEKSGDPIVNPIVIQAATRRGNTARVMLAIMAHQPENEQAFQAWQKALSAMAYRVQPSHLITHGVDDQLAVQPGLNTLREKILAAGIDRLSPESNSVANNGLPTEDPYPVAVEYNPQILGELLLRRAELRLAAGDYESALADYQHSKPSEMNLTSEQAWRTGFGQFNCLMALGRYQQILEIVEPLLEAARNSPDSENQIGQVDNILLSETQSRIDAGQYPQAQDLIQCLKTWAIAANNPALDQSAGLLAGKIEEMTRPEPVETQSQDQGAGDAVPATGSDQN